MLTVALAGNPNCGKTTVFNALTGANQHVGNWPGVTVEKKEGSLSYKNVNYKIVDLPGTYSLGAYSEDEIIARDFILKEKPDLIINVVDATNIERNLYLTLQLLEMQVKVILALNMMDEAEANGIKIDIDSLSRQLGVPVIPIIASRGRGINVLKEKISQAVSEPKSAGTNRIIYGKNIHEAILSLKNDIENTDLTADYPAEWVGLKLLENDKYIIDLIKKNSPDILKKVNSIIDDLSTSEGFDTELLIVDKRYELIGKIVAKSIKKPKIKAESVSDKIDKVLTHKWFGLPIFIITMYLIYQMTFTIGSDLLGEYVGTFIEYLAGVTENVLKNINASDMLISFVTDGIFGGIGAVLEFIPLIMVLYILMGILEDSGYMARAAYVMDRIMRALGLHGKTFISMLVGVGCNVPGIMSTRTLDSKKDRMIAILINPFISCGARLPIYLMFIAAFFPGQGAIMLFIIYATGFAVAVLTGKLLSKTLFKGETSYFIMELPPYRMPSVKGVFIHMWEKVGEFLKRAGTIIFVVVTLLWMLSVLPYGVEPYSEASILGKIGSFLSPIFRPAGFGTWQASVGLLAGIVAKEAVVATLGMVYAGIQEGQGFSLVLQQEFTPLTAFAFMIMTLLYTPCASVIATIKRETNSWKWTMFSIIFTFLVGWLGAVLVFQVGRILGYS